MVGEEGVEHAEEGDEGEEPCRNLTDAIAKVEQANGEAADDDGKLQPGEEGALVGEKDLGLDADGQSDALAVGGLEKGLGGHCVCMYVWGGIIEFE